MNQEFFKTFDKIHETYEELIRARLDLYKEIKEAAALIDCEATKTEALCNVARAYTRARLAEQAADQIIMSAMQFAANEAEEEARDNDLYRLHAKEHEARDASAEDDPPEQTPSEAAPPTAG